MLKLYSRLELLEKLQYFPSQQWPQVPRGAPHSSQRREAFWMRRSSDVGRKLNSWKIIMLDGNCCLASRGTCGNGRNGKVL